MYQLTESVIPHQTLFQHQLGYVWPTIKHAKLFTQNVANITYNLKPLQMQNLKRKKREDMAYYVPHVWKSGGHTSPVSPTKLRPRQQHKSKQHN